MQIKSFTFAGHSAVFFELQVSAAETKSLAIDPWLDTNPACPPSIKNPARLDYIVLTHGHFDHAGEVVSLAKKYGAKIYCNYELSSILKSEGVSESQLEPMNKGGSITIEGLKISLTHAFHSSSYDTSQGAIYAGEPCGIVLSDGKTTIYHAGDTALFSDLKLIGESHKPQIALLPIGDRFTMGPKEAAQAATLVGASLAIPVHYNTFPVLTGTYAEFAEECSKYGISSKELAPGEQHRVM